MNLIAQKAFVFMGPLVRCEAHGMSGHDVEFGMSAGVVAKSCVHERRTKGELPSWTPAGSPAGLDLLAHGLLRQCAEW